MARWLVESRMRVCVCGDVISLLRRRLMISH